MSSSFTAHILFNMPTILPTGKERTHRMGGKWVDEVAASSPDERAAKVERVFLAVKYGACTVTAIANRLCISETVIKRSLSILEDWPEGPRVRRIREFPAHRFEVIE